MNPQSTNLRFAKPTVDEGVVFARYLDRAAEGFFRFMLGSRSEQILANAYRIPGHDLSYEHVVFVEQAGEIAGMVSGYTAEQHRRSSLQPLRDAAGGWSLRMRVVTMLFAPLLRIIDSIEDHDFYLQAIAIDEPLRGTGLGGLLMDIIEQQAIDKGAKRLALDVSAGNQAAIRVYKHRGMQIEAQWPRRVKIPGFKLYRMTKAVAENSRSSVQGDGVPRESGLKTTGRTC